MRAPQSHQQIYIDVESHEMVDVAYGDSDRDDHDAKYDNGDHDHDDAKWAAETQSSRRSSPSAGYGMKPREMV